MIRLSEDAASRPRSYMAGAGVLSLLLILLVAVPSLWPASVPVLNGLQIDTDPENMLEADEPVRVLHNDMKREFGLYDMIVVGVVNPDHPQGVFNVESLKNIHALTEYAQTLQWEADGEQRGVIGVDVIAPSTVDNIEQAGPGTVRFEWLMAEPPASDAEALAVSEKAQRIPFLDNTLVSDDGKSIALYVPITSKDVSFNVASRLRDKIATLEGDEQYYITGLPVAQDQFGVEMFRQMAVSAPLAMLLIFVLMWFFFRNVRLVVSPLIVAMVSVIITMGLLIVTGNTVHIMSSMIPIFIMPIAVLDAVHILSDFFDRYPRTRDRRETIREVMEELSRPMLFTSLTTAVGFASLALTPIPPVQVFGLFVGLGVIAAWLLTITLVPAYIMMMPEKSLQNFGMAHHDDPGGNPGEHPSLLARLLYATGNFAFGHAKLLVLAAALLMVGAGYGISLIRINDNPVKWFTPEHEIRVADRVLNEKFAGTYMAYLAFKAEDTTPSVASYVEELSKRIEALPPRVAGPLREAVSRLAQDSGSPSELVEQLLGFARGKQDDMVSDDDWDAWDEAVLLLESEGGSAEVFKRPEVLAYLAGLQEYLLSTELVGKSNSLPDIVKTVHRELFLGEESAYRIPDSSAAVAQTLITYQSSHRPQDLWHFVTPDYRMTNLWIQLKSGDNVDMNRLVKSVDTYIKANPAPVVLQHDWFGLTYINVIWQQKMVAGMARAFLGSFVIVLVMMIFLFRSPWWGALSMVPLTVTIVVTYGVIGLIGKDYDMPVAVLSSLSLGLAVDYAIHFLARSRQMRNDHDSWKSTLAAVFGEPARAITRNIIVIGCGFLPLLAAPLVPYKTVGVFISTILVLAGAATLLLLPSLVTLFQGALFKNSGTTNEGVTS
jgi:uncharacterized protein